MCIRRLKWQPRSPADTSSEQQSGSSLTVAFTQHPDGKTEELSKQAFLAISIFFSANEKFWFCVFSDGFPFFFFPFCENFEISRAAEQLVGIEQDPTKYTPTHTRFQRGSSSIRRRFRTDVAGPSDSPGAFTTPSASVSYLSTPIISEEENDLVEGDFYLLAKSYFDCREYRRAAHVLRDQTGKKAIFMRCYALYLVCLKTYFSTL